VRLRGSEYEVFSSSCFAHSISPALQLSVTHTGMKQEAKGELRGRLRTIFIRYSAQASVFFFKSVDGGI